MSEIRQDPTTKEWVIIATERRKRPSDFAVRTPRPEPLDYLNSCPFCPGNESMTAPSVLFYPVEPGSKSWQVRVFANKFPAVNPDAVPFREFDRQLFLKVEGSGYHEVIVESPRHNGHLARMTDVEVSEVLKAYRERYIELAQKPGVKSIVIFKNYGLSAGTSIEHPHSQVIATSVVPRYIRTRSEVAVNYFDEKRRSLYSDIRDNELDAGVRIIIETEKFVVFHPFASQRPFETWIMPKESLASFGHIRSEDIPYLAQVLKQVLLKLYYGLDNPDYNLVVDSAPVGEECSDYYQWHLRIVPRITDVAGFEIGSGIFINTVLPEETAPFLKNVKV